MNTYTIGIIGGTGQMGRWFERFFTNLGHQVLIAGRKTPLKVNDCVQKSHIVILSVPVDAVIDYAEKIGPSMGEDQLLMDICSLKETVLEAMDRCTPAEVIGTHPLFGPFTDSIRGQNIIVCPGKGTRWIKWLKNELKEKGAIVTAMEPALHDQHMAVVQGLTHFITICMGKTFQKLGMTPEDILPSSTPVFRLKLNLVGRLFAQDLNLYQNLIGNNPYTADVLETFLAAMTRAKEELLSPRNGNGLSFLEEIRDHIGKFCKNGLEESNDLLNALSENP